MRIRYLVLLLLFVAWGCGRPEPPPPARNPILPRAGAGTLTLTNSGTGAATLSGDPTNGYLLNIPYFTGFLTTSGTSGAATVMNGVMNIPNYATGGGGGITLPPGSFPGQSLIVGTGNMVAAVSPGLAEAMASPVSGTVSPSCGSTSSIGDLSQTFVLQTGSTVNIPAAACTSAVFYFFSQGTAAFNAPTGQMLNVYNGTTYTSGTAYAASAGQYVTLIRSKTANTWIAAVGNAGAGGGGGMVPAGSTGITSLTTSGTNGTASYSSSTGVLNIPDYSSQSSGITLPSGALPGQVLAVGVGGTVIAGSPGLSDSGASPVSANYTPSCGTIDTGDRTHVAVITAAVTVTIPSATNASCTQAVFYFLMRAAAVIQRSGTDTFDVYNGVTALTAQTSYTSGVGQYITVANGNGTNWHVIVGYAGPAALNIQQHYFSPDFTLSGSTVISSVGQGAGPITALSTPQLLCNYYFIIDTPTANQKIQAHIYRTTGAIPTLGAAPGGSDVQVAIVTFPYAASGALTTVGGAIFDLTGPVTGTAYNYYLAVDSAVAQNVNIHSQSYLQVAEAP